MTEWAHRVRPQTVHQECRALQGCIIRHPPHHGGAPVEAHPKRVAQTALRSCRTVATGGRTAMRQRPPRAGTSPPPPRTKLSRKRGSGGRATKSTIWCSPEPSPRRSFRPFWIAPKGARRRGGEMPQIKKHGTKPAGGAIPSPTGAKGYKWGGRAARRVVAPYRVAPPDARRTTGAHRWRRILSG